MVLRLVLVYAVERLSLAVVMVAATLAGFLLLAHEVKAGTTLHLDRSVFYYFQARQWSPLHALMQGISLLASGWAIIAVSLACAISFWWKPAPRLEVFSLLVSVAGGQGVVYGLKALFHRARPETSFASLGYSFPSGHAFAAVTLYGMLAYWLGRGASRGRRMWLWSGATLLILLIGFSRVFLGVHYASDVAAGFAAGLPWLWGCLAVPAYYTRRGKK